MMRIGYLDDEYDILKSAIRSLKKYDIEIVALKNIDDVTNITMLTDAIISDSLECLLVDYDLMKLESKVYGTQIIKDINEILPDFTCFLLTNFTEQGINEKIEVTKLEYEKLVEKKKERQISASEEDRFIYLYKVLSSYDYVDKMPDILVRNSTQDTLEEMLATLKEFKQCLRKE